MKEERSGIFDKQKQDYLKNHNNKKEFNNDYNFAEENIYDIKEQKRLLEEFERKKKKEKEKVKSFYMSNEQNNPSNNTNKFVLDDNTVKKNRLIICNIENIFDDENEEDEFNMNDFNWDNNIISGLNQITNNANRNKLSNINERHSSININQINNNINNIHNQEVINQFFDFTQHKINNKNNYNSQNPNMNIINGTYNNIQNNKYNDDFNPFLD